MFLFIIRISLHHTYYPLFLTPEEGIFPFIIILLFILQQSPLDAKSSSAFLLVEDLNKYIS